MIKLLLIPAAALAAFVAVSAGPGFALTTKECSVKYQASKAAGTLGGLSWNDFRKKECGSDAEAAAETKPADAKSADAKPAVKAAPTAATGAVFPKAVDAKYAKESAGKARRHTCLDQYRANKATNGNAELKWIQKGGGYYSQCNSALKG